MGRPGSDPKSLLLPMAPCCPTGLEENQAEAAWPRDPTQVSGEGVFLVLAHLAPRPRGKCCLYGPFYIWAQVGLRVV